MSDARPLPAHYCAACHWPLACTNADCPTVATSDAPLPALGELEAADATLIAEFRRCCEEWGASMSDNWHARVEDTEAALTERVAQLVAAARRGLEETVARNQRIVDLVCAEGSVVRPSGLNPGRVVVVDGRTGLDASELSAAACFDALFDEADGGDPPLRVEITVGSLTPERHA